MVDSFRGKFDSKRRVTKIDEVNGKVLYDSPKPQPRYTSTDSPIIVEIDDFLFNYRSTTDIEMFTQIDPALKAIGLDYYVRFKVPLHKNIINFENDFPNYTHLDSLYTRYDLYSLGTKLNESPGFVIPVSNSEELEEFTSDDNFLTDINRLNTSLRYLDRLEGLSEVYNVSKPSFKSQVGNRIENVTFEEAIETIASLGSCKETFYQLDRERENIVKLMSDWANKYSSFIEKEYKRRREEAIAEVTDTLGYLENKLGEFN